MDGKLAFPDTDSLRNRRLIYECDFRHGLTISGYSDIVLSFGFQQTDQLREIRLCFKDIDLLFANISQTLNGIP